MTKSSEREEYSLRELLRQEMSVVRQELTDIKVSVARIETQNEATEKTIGQHRDAILGNIKDIIAVNDRLSYYKGALKVLGGISLTGIIALIKTLFYK